MIDVLRIAHLRIAPQEGNSEVGNCEVHQENLDKFLKTIPDEPKIGGAMPMNSRQSNSIIHQMERGEWKTVDPAGSHHLSKADSDDMLLVLTVHA